MSRAHPAEAADALDAPLPPLSFVVPVLNEQDYVERALDSILRQRYPAPIEVVVALGPSTDATDEIVARRAEQDPRIRLLHVDRARIPVGLNRAMAACRYPVIARVDAHVELPEGYAETAVRTLLAKDAANVGGIMSAVGETSFQRAVADAYNSRWGLGGAAYHLTASRPDEAESAYLGVMRADRVAAVGGFDESLARGEDWELNQRLRRAGYGVWLDPALHVTYRPRATARDLARQFWATGAWRAVLVRRLGAANSLRYFAPPALVLCSTTGAAAAALVGLGLGSGPLRLVATVSGAGTAAHLGLVGAVAARHPGRRADRARFAAALVVMHYAWGGGFLAGLLRGAEGTHDRSRVTAAALRPVRRRRAVVDAGVEVEEP